jgi:CRISPR-associated protein Cmr6
MSEFYPVPKNISQLVKTDYRGNFGLYWAKYMPLDESKSFDLLGHKADGLKGEENEFDKLLSIYSKCKDFAKEDLKKKHDGQKEFIEHKLSHFYTMTIRASLKSRLVTGLGQAHPTETGMVFDHNLGIPCIPAASIKGLVRFSHKLINNLPLGVKDSRDADPKTLIPQIFGGKKIGEKKTEEFRGSVIFLDAYPESVPDLEIDIMTPHFTEYYEKGSDKWPTDTFKPVPVKFLTVKPGTVFVFHALIPKEAAADVEPALHKAYEEALVYEGVGAKTAVGYGRFKIVDEQASEAKAQKQVNAANKPSAPAKPENATQVNPHPVGSKDYFLFDLKESEKGIIDQRFLEWRDNDQLNTDAELARLFWNKIDLRNAKGKINKRAKYILTICPDLKNSIDG